MKYLIALLVGLCAGLAVAAALVYYNPLTRGQSLPPGNAEWVLDYTLDPAANWIATHDRGIAAGVMPADVALLWEGGIRRSVLNAMPLSDAGRGSTAAATRISVPSPATEFLQSGVMVDDFWLISVPGEGSVFVHSLSNLWPLLRDTVVRVDLLRRDWAGPAVYGPTRGPAAAGATLWGLSGSFTGATGRGRERMSLDRYTAASGLSGVTGRLLLEINYPEP